MSGSVARIGVAMTVVVPTYRMTVTMNRKSSVERDKVMNTWHFIAPSGTPTSTDFGNMMNVYKEFLESIRSWFSATLAGQPDSLLVEFWKLTAEKPPPGTGLGPPVSSGQMGWTTPPSTVGYPSEVSSCITLDGTTVLDAEHGTGGTRPASRKRNRKYVGPLAATAGSADPTTSEIRPTVTFRTALTNAILTHLINAAIAKGWALTGFSPTNWQTFPLKSVWVDDAFDTQRRRGEEPTIQTLVPTPGAFDAFVEAHAREGQVLELDALGNLRRS